MIMPAVARVCGVAEATGGNTELDDHVAKGERDRAAERELLRDGPGWGGWGEKGERERERERARKRCKQAA